MKVSNSELRSFKRCRRNWWLTYVLRLRRRHEGPGPLAIGNMVHYVLDKFYTYKSQQAALATNYATSGAWVDDLMAYVKVRVDELEANGGDHMVAGMLTDAELARIMLDGYFEWLTEEGVDAQLEILSSEQELEAYLGSIEGEEVWLIAKLDILAALRDTGEALFLDHKTVQALGDLPKVAHLDEQLRTYGLVQRLAIAAGTLDAPRAVGGTLNMLRKVKRTATAKPPFYGRFSSKQNEETFGNFYKRVFGEVSDIMLVRKQLAAGADHQVVVYPNPTRDCAWQCPFLGICGMLDDGSDVDVVIADMYEQHDPYERYEEIEKA